MRGPVDMGGVVPLPMARRGGEGRSQVAEMFGVLIDKFAARDQGDAPPNARTEPHGPLLRVAVSHADTTDPIRLPDAQAPLEETIETDKETLSAPEEGTGGHPVFPPAQQIAAPVLAALAEDAAPLAPDSAGPPARRQAARAAPESAGARPAPSTAPPLETPAVRVETHMAPPPVDPVPRAASTRDAQPRVRLAAPANESIARPQLAQAAQPLLDAAAAPPTPAPSVRAADPLPEEPLRSAAPAAPAEGRAEPAQPVRVLHIRLHPAELGEVTVRMRLSGEGLELAIEAHRSETATLLRQDRETLAQVLRASGAAGETVSVTIGERAGGQAAGFSDTAPQRGGQPQAQTGGDPSEGGPRQDRPDHAAPHHRHEEQGHESPDRRPRADRHLYL